jgi:hypothetical protein
MRPASPDIIRDGEALPVISRGTDRNPGAIAGRHCDKGLSARLCHRMIEDMQICILAPELRRNHRPVLATVPTQLAFLC